MSWGRAYVSECLVSAVTKRQLEMPILRLGLVEEALREARFISRLDPNDRLSLFLIEEAEIQSTMGEAERRLRVSRMPVFSPAMANVLRRLQTPAPPLSNQQRSDPTQGN